MEIITINQAVLRVAIVLLCAFGIGVLFAVIGRRN